MKSHALPPTTFSKPSDFSPFGLGQTKPKHFRDMLNVLWDNRDNLSYALKILTRGVCDGCALGVAGLSDWTIEGPHLCMTRLNLLRLNTMPELDHALLSDTSALSNLDNTQLRNLGRLAYPMVREKNAKGFRRLTWEETFQRLGHHFRTLPPQRTAFFVTARGVTNEVYYLAQKTARFLGTNHIDNAARLCHAPSTTAMKRTIGVAATTCSYKDWYGTDLIIFFGSNPANDQPVTTKYLHEAKEHGTKIVLVNPYLEPGMQRYWVPSTFSSAVFGTDIADYWFPVTQGGDIAFLSGVIKILLENNWLDNSFIQQHTTDFNVLKSHLERLDWSLLESQAGLPRSSFLEFAELIRDAKNAVLVWSMGITQHTYGADAVQMILNLGLVRGYVGRDKCGLMPIRGHSSVQGGAEMGAYSTVYPGGKPITSENADALSQHYGFPVPDWTGMTTTQMVDACANDNLDLLYCLGGNFLRTLPDPESVRQSLRNVPIRVHQDIILTDQMFIEGKEEVYLLPAKTRYEQDDGGVETSTERRVMFSPEIPRQVGKAMAEWKILQQLAVHTHPHLAEIFGCQTGQAIREEIARVVPFYEGIQHLKKTGDAFQYGGPHLCPNGHFPLPNGKAVFHAVPLPNLTRKPGEFEISTRRGKQFNTLIYAEIDPLNNAPRDAVLISEEDAHAHHLAHLDPVILRNDMGEYHGRAFIAPIAPGNLQLHWPEGNVIVHHGLIDESSGVPDYNTRATLHKA